MIAMSVPNKRKRGRPKGNFMDAIKEDIKVTRVKKRMPWTVENGGK